MNSFLLIFANGEKPLRPDPDLVGNAYLL